MKHMKLFAALLVFCTAFSGVGSMTANAVNINNSLTATEDDGRATGLITNCSLSITAASKAVVVTAQIHSYNMFGCTTVNGEKHQLECYQYTVVNGVIFVE